MAASPDDTEHRQLAREIAVEPLRDLAEEAGRAIMDIFHHGFSVSRKDDDSPVTEADLAASRIILRTLEERWPWPVLSEEAAAIDWATRSSWDTYWLVDPLDGTREFIRRSTDFTVNIALIHRGIPVFGLIHAPVDGTSWWGDQVRGAWRQKQRTAPQPLSVAPLPERISDWIEVGSRSHRSEAAAQYSAAIGPHRIKPVGSSLKMCHIAAGEAHLYIRLGPTGEWDTAAGQAILEAAGGVLVRVSDLTPLRYNTRAQTVNPWFIAASALDSRWTTPLSAWQ